MKTALLSAAFVLVAAHTARADEDVSFFERPIAAPMGAFEISVATGFARAAGKLERGVSLDASGSAFEIEVGYRISPHLSVGWYGTFADFGNAGMSSTDAYSLSTGIQGRWHLSPFRAFDPWISLGGGLHAFIVDSEMDDQSSYMGVDLLRLQAGADLRFSPRLAISPIVGLDVTTFLRTVDEWENDYRVEERRLSVFFFAGLGGRFDFGGADVPPPR